MTYTFKLARRLAVSRSFVVLLPAILLFTACDSMPESSNPLGPQDDWTPRAVAPVTVSVNPKSVTVETNQLIRFLAHGRNANGDSVYAPVVWRTTGGTILPDGRFSSASVGTFAITGTTSSRGGDFVDSSVVMVVRRQINLKSVVISPQTATLAPGVTFDFSATGRLADGRAVAIGVVWTATGGTIDAGGTFVAGDTAGTYQVIASNTSFTLSDTAQVTITAPPPAPAPTPPPPPAPTLAEVTMLPATATLAPSTTRLFKAYGRLETGDSVAIDVVFTGTGGTITSGGLYTAGTIAGTYQVVATAGSLADTSRITVTEPLSSGPGVGVPFGAFNGFGSETALKPNTGAFSMSHDGTTSLNILDRINTARRLGIRLSLALIGGSSSQYLTNGVWDKAKWTARLQTYNTPAIRQAVAEAVSDGTVIAGNVMDEPFNEKWGPTGTLTKAIVDGLCADVKAVFPTLAVGVTHDQYRFEPTKSYRVCDYILSQYRHSKGDVTDFRDGGLALAQRDGHSIAFSLNILDGGYQIAGCPVPQTGGPGTYGGNCRMTAAQIREYARVLGPAGCAMFMWRYEDDFMANPDNIQAFRDVAAMLANAQRKSCKRP